MKRFIILTNILSCSLIASMIFSSNNMLQAFANSAQTWVHYDENAELGVREYWIQCGGRYQFNAPSGVTIKEGTNYNTSEFSENDPRWLVDKTDYQLFYDLSKSQSDDIEINSFCNGYSFVNKDGTPFVWTNNAGDKNYCYAIKDNNKTYKVSTIVVSKVITTYSELINCVQLKDTTSSITGYFVLGSDVGVESTDKLGGANGMWEEKIGFRGTLDGRGHTINARPSGVTNGLFGVIGTGAVIKNLQFSTIYYDGWGGTHFLAKAIYNSTIENVSFSLSGAGERVIDWSTNTNKSIGVISSLAKGTTFNNITVNSTHALDTLFGCNGGSCVGNTYNNFVVNAPRLSFVGSNNLVNWYLPKGTDCTGHSNWYLTDITLNTVKVTPDGVSHPRVMINQNDIPLLKSKLNNSYMNSIKTRLESFASTSEDGDLTELLTDSGTICKKMAIAESKAMEYLFTNNESLGLEALAIVKKATETINFSLSKADYCRTYGYVMFVSAEVYDWCYNLMGTTDKETIINNVISNIVSHLEITGPDKLKPTLQSNVGGHGIEAQLLRDWFAFAIATYDERPEYYRFVFDRISNYIVEAQNYIYQSGTMIEGVDYGAYRTAFSLYAQRLFNAYSGGSLFNNKYLKDALESYFYYQRPDEQSLRIGDVYNEYGDSFLNSEYRTLSLLGGSLLNSDLLNSYFYSNGSYYCPTWVNDNGASPCLYLISIDPTLAKNEKLFDNHNLVKYFTNPSNSVIANTSNNAENNAMVYMNIGGSEASGHQHLDYGNFQLFYKSILASDSGQYDTWGSKHHMSYTTQTIAHNSLLVYNPNMVSKTPYVYSGGQSLEYREHPKTLMEWKTKPHMFESGKVIGYSSESTNTSFEHAYLSGDITKAYDEETVDEVSRYMYAFNTNDSSNPLALFVYDRITSDDASYKKTFLLHSQTEPELNSTSATIVNKDGKMFIQTIGNNVSYSKIGGLGNEFNINGTNYPGQKTPGSASEYGWGRIEISPKTSNLTDRLLNVLYVTDSSNTANMKQASSITSATGVIGATLFNQTIVFPENKDSFDQKVSFTTSGDEQTKIVVVGMNAKTYSVKRNGTSIGTFTADARAGLITFNSLPGQLIIEPVR